MDIQEKKELVCSSGLRLISEGLIARTWGNISVRVDDDSFVITPSGLAYETLGPGEVIQVRIEDLGYEGDIKPSSEKGIHAGAYRMDPETNAVIHTHQIYASIAAAARCNVLVEDKAWQAILGTQVLCAGYGLPGTKKLSKATARALKGHSCALMANHGAVCVGKTMDEAFEVARVLEAASRAFIEKAYCRIAGATGDVEHSQMHKYYLENLC